MLSTWIRSEDGRKIGDEMIVFSLSAGPPSLHLTDWYGIRLSVHPLPLDIVWIFISGYLGDWSSELCLPRNTHWYVRRLVLYRTLFHAIRCSLMHGLHEVIRRSNVSRGDTLELSR